MVPTSTRKKKPNFSIQYLKHSLLSPCSVVSQYAAFFVLKEKAPRELVSSDNKRLRSNSIIGS